MNSKVLLGIIAVLVIITAFLLLRQPSTPVSSLCGNNICDPDDKLNCPQDCVLVNGVKQNDTKPPDGGVPPIGTCGDGKCDSRNETPQNCPTDCGITNPNPQPNPNPVPGPAQPVNLSAYEDSPFSLYPAFVPPAKNTNTSFGVDYSYAQDLGARWQRSSGVGYEYIDLKDAGHYNFKEYIEPNKNIKTNPDKTITEASKSGIFILENIYTFTTDFNDYTSYTNFVKAAVERYDGDEDYGCVVSAPDCYFAGDNQYPSQELITALKNNPIKYWQAGNNLVGLGNFAIMQKNTYLAVKSADPNATVLIGGDGADNRYIDILHELNGQYIDIFDFHWFGDAIGEYRLKSLTGKPMTFDPEGIYHEFRTLLDQTGFDNIPIWIAEMATYSGKPNSLEGKFGGFPFQSEQEQAISIIKRNIYPLSIGIKKIFLAYSLVEGYGLPEDNDYMANTGMVYDGNCYGDCKTIWPNGVEPVWGTKKLSYYSYKLMVEKLEGSNWSNIQEIQPATNVYAYKFINKQTNKPTYVIWWDYWNEPSSTTKQVTIPVSITGTAKITESVPHFTNGLLLQNSGEVYPNFFDTETKQVVSGQLSLTLGQNPVYIEQN